MVPLIQNLTAPCMILAVDQPCLCGMILEQFRMSPHLLVSAELRMTVN
jgi:hypothetical protein